MRQDYQITIVAPPKYLHTHAFLEVAFLLRHAFRDLGFDAPITLNTFPPDRTTIVLGWHLMSADESLASRRYIPWQLEQVSAPEFSLSENLWWILRHAAQVWDYSTENSAFLAARGITARILPVGFHPSLEMIPHAGEKDIPVLFYGSLGQRRQRIVSALELAQIPVRTLFGVYGKERDSLIGRSRIVLNIHHYSARIFEAVRVSYLLNNRIFVLSEESTVYPYPGVEMSLVRYDALVESCLTFLSKKGEIDELARETYHSFRDRYPMSRLLAEVVESN